MKIGLALPTRDRPKSVSRLLDSLIGSTVLIDEIAIVSYGVDLTETLKPYTNSLHIIYHRSAIPGQVAQKRKAIDLLSNDLTWCIFTDDDLEFEPQAIETALKSAEDFKTPVLGIGFSLPPTSRLYGKNLPSRFIARAFGLDGKRAGQVLKSGHATSYLHLENNEEVDWLNGVSMWRMEVARNYGAGMIPTKYAACEDLIFSYPVSKQGKLVFAHNAIVRFQEGARTNFESLRVFESAAYFRLYFVQTNRELSVLRYLISQFARTIFASLKSSKVKPSLILNYWRVFFRVLVQSFFSRQPNKLILGLTENPSTNGIVNEVNL